MNNLEPSHRRTRAEHRLDETRSNAAKALTRQRRQERTT